MGCNMLWLVGSPSRKLTVAMTDGREEGLQMHFQEDRLKWRLVKRDQCSEWEEHALMGTV